ncbi:OmpA family protein [Aminipila butyrica]|uniref:OmpA family protein n=1 Tax=Aminipila butyrica TaxID=433296 RepID=A0A858BVG1_9FIRM|nr:OmpA family protein [Aminipila butyrica]QIB68754.1 OmpA family protein [Aminipila butyrica]
MARKKKHKKHEEEPNEAWLLPYSDLMTLLLAVFIVLFAVSQVDQAKAEAMAEQFQEMVSSQGSGSGTGNGTGTGAGEAGQPNALSESSVLTEEELAEYMGDYELDELEQLKAELDAKLIDEHMTASVTTSIDMRGLVVSLNNAVFFDSGSAAILTDNINTLNEVAATINTMDNYIRIEGHTDNVPMNSEQYPSNWELSSARAASVVKLFINSGVSPAKLVSVGYGEYRPVADNDTGEGRAKNRRIDIIVLSEKYNNLEKQLIE